MSDEHPIIDDPDLGTFTRATAELTDGTVLTHEWYAGTLDTGEGPVELMLEGATAEESRALLPRLRSVVSRVETLRRSASDAIVVAFSQGEPEAHEFDEAATDLALDAIEATTEATTVLHFTDTCGTHFPEGYWPAVHLDDDDAVVQVTVES